MNALVGAAATGQPEPESGAQLIAAARGSLPLRSVTQQRRGTKHQTPPRNRPPASQPASPEPNAPPKKTAEDWSKLRDLVWQACSKVDLGLAQLHRDFWVAHGEGAIAAARRAVAAHERRQSLDSVISGSLMEKVSYNASHPIPSPAAFVTPLDICPASPLSLTLLVHGSRGARSCLRSWRRPAWS